jgi:hypothetical protein
MEVGRSACAVGLQLHAAYRWWLVLQEWMLYLHVGFRACV